jgi:RNA dependent RNA polymerase
MTDGCGLINHKALVTIVRSFNHASLPAGVQGRIDGSKGFWILHPTDDSDVPKIWIRHSQDKIKNSGFDRAHRIFDLLGPSRPSSSIALSAQSIVNLFSNGIPDSVLIHLMEQGLMDEISPLLEWNKPHGMIFLWDAVNKCGNVSGCRTQRLSTSLNRALGLKGRDWSRDGDREREDSDEDSKTDETPFSTFTGRNKYSGGSCLLLIHAHLLTANHLSGPLSLHETTVELIQAGFHPAHSQLLFDKIKNVIEKVIKGSVEKCRIPISESFDAYVVPGRLFLFSRSC